MFEKGQYIIYGASGVCRVEDISVPDFMGDRTTLYYTLAPVRDTGKIYIPVATTKFMRPILTKEEALNLIAQIPAIEKCEYESRDHRMLAEHYKRALDSHECEDLVQLLKTIYQKNRDLAQRGKRPSNTDTQFFKKAEDLLYSELSIALDIPFNSVEDYIAQQVENKK